MASVSRQAAGATAGIERITSLDQQPCLVLFLLLQVQQEQGPVLCLVHDHALQVQQELVQLEQELLEELVGEELLVPSTLQGSCSRHLAGIRCPPGRHSSAGIWPKPSWSLRLLSGPCKAPPLHALRSGDDTHVHHLQQAPQRA